MLDKDQKSWGHENQVGTSKTLRDAAPSHPIRDFIVEFFGILLPGFAFTAGLVFTLVLPLYTLVVSQEGAGVLSITSTGTEVWQVVEAFQMALLIAAAALSYVCGHVFYRLDPKLPDTISYWSLPEDCRKSDPGYCDEQRIGDSPEIKDARIAIKRWYDHIWESVNVSTLYEKIKSKQIKRYPRLIDFPYHNLKSWFDEQGMSGLANYVTWFGCDNNRTRHLDLMKIAVEFTFPEQYSRLARNEAHVRLVCSIWYASCYLIYFALVGILVAVVSNRLTDPYSLSYPTALLVPLVGLVGMVWLKRSIEQSLHSMRIREIVYVFAHFRCAREMSPQIIDVLAAQLLEMEGGYAAGQGGGEHFAQGSWDSQRKPTASQSPASGGVKMAPAASR